MQTPAQPPLSPSSDAIGPTLAPRAYTRVQRWLHWMTAGLVLLQYLLQEPMSRAMRIIDANGEIGVGGFAVTTLHSLGGATIGALLWWRWRLARRRPVTPGAGMLSHRWQRVASLVHRALYVGLAVMVASGLLHYYVGWEPAAKVHEAGKWVLSGCVVVHMLAALWHQLVRRDAVLRRMLGW